MAGSRKAGGFNLIEHGAPRSEHEAAHYARESQKPGFTYGDPGPDNRRAHANGDPRHYVTVPFSFAVKREDLAGDLMTLDAILRAYANGQPLPATMPKGMESLGTRVVPTLDESSSED
jgi:hypothetical protein